MKRWRIPALAALVLWLVSAGAGALQAVAAYAPSERELVNPFIGNAAWANDDSPRQQPFTLVYANLTWAELEPQEGLFAFESFEEENHFDLWREQGKRLILRFVLDVPGDDSHRDIPDWVYARTGDGQAYDVSYGQGYCPNYAHPELIRLHGRAVEAIAARYGDDPFVAYVELGSLGHWGEWHVHEEAGVMPDAAVREAYVAPYLGAFSHARLMMRRPFAIAAENSMGLYNDAAGTREPTEEWLGWIAQGGDYDSTSEKGALVAMPEAWKTAPIGGELTPSMDWETLLGGAFSETAALFAASHASWIGPHSFVDVERGSALQPALDFLNRGLGYRLRVSKICLVGDEEAISLSLTWENDGVAPFYFDWTPCLRLADGGREVLVPLDLRLADVLPGMAVSVEARVEGWTGPCRIDVGVLDPETGEPGVALAMDVQIEDGWHRLLTVD